MHNTERTPPRPSPLRALIVLNAVLLGVLAVVTFAPSVSAQGRIRGMYTMVAGGANNLQSSAVYVIDSVNQEMIVLTYDAAKRSLSGLAYRNLAADSAELTRGRTRAGG